MLNRRFVSLLSHLLQYLLKQDILIFEIVKLRLKILCSLRSLDFGFLMTGFQIKEGLMGCRKLLPQAGNLRLCTGIP